MAKGIGAAIVAADKQTPEPAMDELIFTPEGNEEELLVSDALPGMDHALSRVWQAVQEGDERSFKRAIRNAMEMAVELALTPDLEE